MFIGVHALLQSHIKFKKLLQNNCLHVIFVIIIVLSRIKVLERVRDEYYPKIVYISVIGKIQQNRRADNPRIRRWNIFGNKSADIDITETDIMSIEKLKNKQFKNKEVEGVGLKSKIFYSENRRC